MKYLIANWKAQKTKEDIQNWMDIFCSLVENNLDVVQALESQKLRIIICPSYPFILQVQDLAKNTGLYVGSQDISSKDPGKYTGEVPAAILKDLVEYAIIGHSERRLHFQETETEITRKIIQCSQNNIQPILCVRSVDDTLHENASIIAYEPVAAIGTGQNEDPTRVVEMKKNLNVSSESQFLYGGSVTKENMESYLETGEVDGFLVGTTSLDAQHFFDLTKLLI